MKNKSELDQYVEERLIEWAEWYKKGGDSGIGFSHRNMLARLREEGGLLISGTGAKSLASHPAAEEIEYLVRELAKRHFDRAKALQIYYFYPIEHELKAKRSGFKKTQYYTHLSLAREWIKGYLYAHKKIF